MNTHDVIIHSNRLSAPGNNRMKLAEGSSVYVKIIKDKGNGNYTGSVAGIRVNLKSNQILKSGSSFIANIHTENGTIYITPKNSENIFIGTKSVSVLSNEQILSLLNELRVPVDQISVNILQQFKQIGFKFNSTIINKFHNIASKYKGKEKLVTEILTVSQDKEIAINEAELEDLLKLLILDKESENPNGKQILNKLNAVNGHWFILPFELVKLIDDSLIGNGLIRFLFDDKVKLMNVDCTANEKRYLFSLSFEKNKLKNVKFNVSGIGNIEVFETLKKKFEPVNVEWAESENIEGTACENEAVLSFEGIV